jgi:hypothetical protein
VDRDGRSRRAFWGVARRTTIGVAQAGFGGLKRPQNGRRTSADIGLLLVFFDWISTPGRISKR